MGKRTGRKKKEICRNWLIYWAICRKMTVREMARMRGVAPSTMVVRLKEQGIRARPIPKGPRGWKIDKRQEPCNYIFTKRCGVKMEKALPPDGVERVRLFLKRLSKVHREAVQEGKTPDVYSFVSAYPKLFS